MSESKRLVCFKLWGETPRESWKETRQHKHAIKNKDIRVTEEPQGSNTVM